VSGVELVDGELDRWLKKLFERVLPMTNMDWRLGREVNEEVGEVEDEGVSPDKAPLFDPIHVVFPAGMPTVGDGGVRSSSLSLSSNSVGPG